MKLRSIAAFMGVLALAACEKNAVQDITGAVPEAKIRFFNMALNAPNVNFFKGDQKLTATLSAVGAPSPLGVAYGGVSSSGFYTGVDVGSSQFSSKLSDTTTANRNVTVSNVTTNVEAGKTYSYYMSGVYNTTTRTSDAFIVEDPYLETIDFTQAFVRFVNASHNSQPMILYAKNTTTGVETAIGGAVAYKSGGAFTPLPNGVYDLSLRLPNSTTNLVTRAAVQFAFLRTNTITLRGDMTVTSTTATNRPFLDNTTNR
ncbi:MAG: DUF4397 domain-containing protein [Gemmatimonas sp.]